MNVYGLDGEDDHFNLEKENTIRRRIMREFNKTEDDFVSLKEYNDYLEEVEDIIYNLVNNIDVEETNRRITDYKIRNRDQIEARKALKIQEERQKRIMAEQQRRQALEESAPALETPMDTPSSSLIETRAEQQQHHAYVPTSADIHNAAHRQPAPKATALASRLSTADQKADMETLRRRAHAGGYLEEVVLKRAFDEAFGSLKALLI